MVKKRTEIGTLIPIFSLRSSKQSSRDQGTFDTGTIFLDWLHQTKQSLWQILPLNESQFEIDSATKRVPSPYKSYGIGLSSQYLSTEFAAKNPTAKEKRAFLKLHKFWLPDYALFSALAVRFKTDDWTAWDTDLRQRDRTSLKKWKKILKDEIDFYILQQWQLHQSYDAMHARAKQLHISLIGDLPFYISFRSPLVWVHQDVFQIGSNGQMAAVSGIPNTAGTLFGRQIWGHPLYQWQKKRKVTAFWKMRLRYQAMLFDRMRFDHAKAFFWYGVIDPQHQENDRYEKGPGGGVLRALIAFCQKQKLTVFIEDSGDKIQRLKAYMKKHHIPGIRIYWFVIYRIVAKLMYDFAEATHFPINCVAYTSTHDTQSIAGYLKTITPAQKKKFAAVSKIPYDSNDTILAMHIRNAVIASPAKTVIIPMQDWLLTTERINVPGTEKEKNDPNWHYEIPMTIEDLPTDKLAL